MFFWAHHLVLVVLGINWYVLPGEDYSPILDNPWLPVVLCLGSHEISPLHVSTLLASSLFRSCLGSRVNEASWE